MNPELRQLRYFVAVAEELHFTRAAERLHMAQQPLSAAIARLEEQLGLRLFSRTTRRVELTPAGAAMLEPARAALRAAEAAVAAARAAADDHAGSLAVGVSPGAWYGLEPLFAAWRARLPRVELAVRQQSTGPLVAAVRAGDLDLAIGLCADDTAGLPVQHLKDEPVLLAVAKGQAPEGAVDLRTLAAATFALDDPAEGPGYNAGVVRVCRAAGLEPRTRTLDTHHDAWQNAIAAGECVGLTIASAIHAHHPGVALVPLARPATFPLALVTRPADEDGVVAALLRVAAAVTAEHAWVASVPGQSPTG